MKFSSIHFDAPFWVALLVGVIFIGSVSFISLAAAAQNAAESDSVVVSVGDT